MADRKRDTERLSDGSLWVMFVLWCVVTVAAIVAHGQVWFVVSQAASAGVYLGRLIERDIERERARKGGGT